MALTIGSAAPGFDLPATGGRDAPGLDGDAGILAETGTL